MNPKPIKKLYYSISEVADMTGLKQYVLRYWETEFLELRPSKNRAGNRIYKEKDINLINQIKDLLYNKKYTIDGARNYLRSLNASEKERTIENTAHTNMKKELIDSIQSELQEIVDVLNGKKVIS
jgi:DNA-binding transcriptional MerR regulator